MSAQILLTACLVRRVRGRLVKKVWCEQSFYNRIVLFFFHSLFFYFLHVQGADVCVGKICSHCCLLTPHQICVHKAQALVWFMLVWLRMLIWAHYSILPSRESHRLLFRELIVLIAARSSFAPRPVPENRCVTCHILNRWTCHMPLKVFIQLSFTLWVNSSSLLQQSLNRQKKC